MTEELEPSSYGLEKRLSGSGKTVISKLTHDLVPFESVLQTW